MVALNPTYRIFLNIVSLSVLPSRQTNMGNNNFHRLVFKLLASNGKTNKVPLTSCDIAMAMNFDIIATAICSLVKPLQPLLV